MKSIVFIKRVPDSEIPRVKVMADGSNLDLSDVKFVINPYDEYAIEQALQLKESDEVTVAFAGNVDATKEIRTALAMGCDKAVWIKQPEGWRDVFGTAKAIANWLKTTEHEAVFFGKEAIDDQLHAVGQMVATLLDVPCVTAINTFEKNGDTVTVKRNIEGGTEVIDVKLPAIFTCDKGLNEPRYAALKGIMAAKKKPIEEVAGESADAKIVVHRYTEPPKRQGGKIVGEGAEAVPALLDALRNDAKAI